MSFTLVRSSLRHKFPSVRYLATHASPFAKVNTAPSIQVIRPSDEEKQSGTLSQRHMQKALEALHHDGIVMMHDVVDHDAIDALNAEMCKDTRILIARGEDGPFNYNLGNLQQSPPNDALQRYPNIFFHPLASHVSNAFLGGKPTMSFVSSNAAVKADQGQPVHVDADFDHPKIPFATVVNIGLVDMNPTNGSTELWLGSHRETTLEDQEGAHGDRASGRVRKELLEHRRSIVPPMQPSVPKGAMLIRDLRLWHAGMPNTTDEIRIMLAMIHFAPWYRQRMSLRLPSTLQRSIEQSSSEANLTFPATYTMEHVDHLEAKFGNAFDFDQDL